MARSVRLPFIQILQMPSECGKLILQTWQVGGVSCHDGILSGILQIIYEFSVPSAESISLTFLMQMFNL